MRSSKDKSSFWRKMDLKCISAKKYMVCKNDKIALSQEISSAILGRKKKWRETHG